MSDVKTILENLGYKLHNDGSKYYRAKPLYRDSGNVNSLRVSKKTGWFTDFGGDGIRGSMVDLVALTLGLKKLEEARRWLESNQYNMNSEQYSNSVTLPSVSRYYPETMLDKLIKEHSYWVKRGVSSEVVARHNGGIALEGFMANRYVFPVREKGGRIIGFAGRDLTGKSDRKWKLSGQQSRFVFPHSGLSECRNSRVIILVESVGDCLALAEAGVNNVLVLFGINLSSTLLSIIAGISPDKVLISLNNDGEENGYVGQKNAEKIKQTLLSYLNPDKVVVALPSKKDFGEMGFDDIIQWTKQYGIN